MPSQDEPFVLLLAGLVCLAAAFPIARFFFEDFETFKEEAGLSRDWERELWLLGCVPSNPMLYFKLVGFVGTLAILFLGAYSLGLRIVASLS